MTARNIFSTNLAKMIPAVFEQGGIGPIDQHAKLRDFDDTQLLSYKFKDVITVMSKTLRSQAPALIVY